MIVDGPHQKAFDDELELYERWRLLAEDVALRSSYMPYLEATYVAGARWTIAPDTPADWNVLVQSRYRLLIDQRVPINRRIPRPGSVMELPHGDVSIISQVAQDACLRLADVGPPQVVPRRLVRSGLHAEQRVGPGAPTVRT